MTRPARAKQADISRAVKAAVSAGLRVVMVETLPDGTIRLMTGDSQPKPVEPMREIVL